MATRIIEPEMVKWLEKKLSGNGLYKESLKQKDARTIFSLAMDSCVGIREVGGNNKGPLVRLIQETVGSAMAEAWCMSLVQTCLAFAEAKTKIVSPIYVSEHCLTVWNDTPKAQRVKFFPLPGAIVIWKHGNGPAGHTGAMRYGDPDTKMMVDVEGNTESGIASGGAVVRDGGGVYVCRRSMKGSGSMKVVGFLKPF